MNSAFSRRILLAGAALALAGCAAQRTGGKPRGPSFLLKGVLEMKRPGRPVLYAQFAWSRGRGFAGWEEKITLHDRTGRRLAKIVVASSHATLVAGGNTRTAGSMAELLAKYTGIVIPVDVLAGWLEGVHDGAPIPDMLEWHGVSVKIVSRSGRTAKPSELLLAHGETRLLVRVERAAQS